MPSTEEINMRRRTVQAAFLVCSLSWLWSAAPARADAPDLRGRTFYIYPGNNWVAVAIETENRTTGYFTGTYYEFWSNDPRPISGFIKPLGVAHPLSFPTTFTFTFDTPPNFVPRAHFNGRLVKLQTTSPYDAYVYGNVYDGNTHMTTYVVGWDWII
jgi:hypothetical protein